MNGICTRIASLLVLATFFLAAGREAGAVSFTQRAGDVLHVAIPATALVATAEKNDRRGTKDFIKSFVINVGVTAALKYSVNRKRPENHGSLSFPSGHTSVSFQGAAFLHRRYGIKVALPAYTAAAFVGWSRVEGESDKHYPSDVIAGAAIGFASGYFLTTRHKGMAVEPFAGKQGCGVFFRKSW